MCADYEYLSQYLQGVFLPHRYFQDEWVVFSDAVISSSVEREIETAFEKAVCAVSGQVQAVCFP
jgi:hypothetical protein